ncbi:increased DNA methylation 3 [Humulus lupulus]|uniref:increased DNA methylation 3 n=1 Tax=Humulus lupulus TaxID=3486 RepID=UPI002B407DCD|nr:increased DNA methylation 3 [Humulus lupulus]XP_062097822.1 increased DNA methylation 3 [Humulus lupulus]XP_062097823.1 increased DNA methylation 3 [Humulus lupulus]XP_062097824.1 increased DNA methylation 3 [Humulus lupulus]
MDGQKFADNPQLKSSVILTGTAKQGGAGPPVGLVDVGESEGAYLFRVALPGIRKDQCKIKCEIQRDGRVHIEGVMNDVGLLKDSSTVYHMKVQQLCPPGPFTISFSLPGPVDPRLFSPSFRPDGILEVVIMKHRIVPPQEHS